MGGSKGLYKWIFDAVENKDYELAASYLHPEYPLELAKFFEWLENEKGYDCSNIQIDKHTGFSSSYYDSTVGVSAYTLQMDVLLSGVSISMAIEIVKNDNGYRHSHIRRYFI